MLPHIVRLMRCEEAIASAYYMSTLIDYHSGTSELDTFIPECGHPRDQYFWLNSVHPTHSVQSLTALKFIDDCFGQTPVGYCT